MSYKSDKVSWSSSASEIRSIREKVFIYEFQFPEDSEFDHDDLKCEHILIRDDNGKAVATGRLCEDGKISRIAVLMKHRDSAIAKQLIGELLKIAKSKGMKKVYFDALLDDVDKYRQQGFKPIGSVYMDAGIAKQPLMCSVDLFKISTTVLH